MKIACIITAYKDPKQLLRTIDRLNVDCYVHIDAKVDITPFIKLLGERENVHFVKDRVFVCWAGWSQVESLYRLMRDVLNSGILYDRILCLSGQDYPVYNKKMIESYFDKTEKNYFTSLNISRFNKSKHAIQKYERYWFYDIKIRNQLIMKCIRKSLDYISYVLYLLNILKKKNNIIVDDKKWDIYFGSDYFCLTYDCCKYVYDVLSNKKEVVQYFKYSFAPSEMVFHTIISNSKYKDTVEHISSNDYVDLQTVTPLQYIDYPPHTSMKILCEEDYEKVIKSRKPFCRKCATGVSDKLMDMFDALDKE